MIQLINVIRIEAYKMDLITYDEIRFDLYLEDRLVTISETQNEFDRIDEYFRKNENNYDSDWRNKVVHPPFEENRTVIFIR